MCWNADISLNTFLFTTFSLVFIYFANTYTRYKSETFRNPLVYVYVFLAASMQLIEHFVWKNLDNKVVNSRLSRLGSAIIILQPVVLMFMNSFARIKYAFLSLYTVFIFISYMYYHFLADNILPMRMSVAKNGHLTYEWMEYKGYDRMILYVYLLFYVLALLFTRNPLLTLFTISTLILSLYTYYTQRTMGTMWCWTSNLFMLYFLVEILHLWTFKTPIINTFSLGFYEFYFLEHIFLSYYTHLPKCSYNILSV